MIKAKVRLRPIVNRINLPTVLKTTILPGDRVERLFIATQVGEVFYIGNGEVRTFLDIRSLIIKLGASGGYDERGLLGLAFHPQFYYNGLFYLHYSVAGTQGPGAITQSFTPAPCNPNSLKGEVGALKCLVLHCNRQLSSHPNSNLSSNPLLSKYENLLPTPANQN